MIKPNTAYLCRTEEIAKKLGELANKQGYPKVLDYECYIEFAEHYKCGKVAIYHDTPPSGYEIIDAETLFTLTETPTQPQKDTDTIEQPKETEISVVGHNAEPIMQFTSQEQLDESLKEWQARLGLSDWIIKAKITDEFEQCGNHGECEFNRVSRCAMIRIMPYYKTPHNEWMAKQPQEQVLVHEILHCIIFTSELHETIQLETYNICQHQILDQMATALIMAKYNITIDWLKV